MSVAAVAIVSMGLNIYLLARLGDIEASVAETGAQVAAQMEAISKQNAEINARLDQMKTEIDRANAIGANVNGIVAQIDSMNKKIEDYVKNPVTIITDIGSGLSGAGTQAASGWEEWRNNLIEKYPQLKFLFKEET